MLTRPLLLKLVFYHWREQSEPAQNLCTQGRIGKPLNHRDQSFLQTVFTPRFGSARIGYLITFVHGITMENCYEYREF
mgnify:FL=1